MNAHALGGQRLQDGLDWRADLLGVDAGGVQQKSAPLCLRVGSLRVDAGDVVQQGVQASEPAAAAPVEIREPFQARAGESDAQRVGAVFHAQADASQSAQRVGLEQLVDASVVAQRRHAVVQVRVVRDRDSRLDAADRFAGLHAEAADVSDRSDLLAAPACSMRVRGVLDQRDVGSVHQVQQLVQFGRVAVDVGGDDGAGAVRDFAAYVGRIDAERLRVGVGEHGRRAAVQGRRDAGVPGDGRHDDFAPAGRAGGEHGRVQGGGAVADGQGEARADEVAELGLELLDFVVDGRAGLQRAVDQGALALGDRFPAVIDRRGYGGGAALNGECWAVHKVTGHAAGCTSRRRRCNATLYGTAEVTRAVA